MKIVRVFEAVVRNWMTVVYVKAMVLRKDSTAMLFRLNLFIINLAFKLFTIYMKPMI